MSSAYAPSVRPTTRASLLPRGSSCLDWGVEEVTVFGLKSRPRVFRFALGAGLNDDLEAAQVVAPEKCGGGFLVEEKGSDGAVWVF